MSGTRGAFRILWVLTCFALSALIGGISQRAQAAIINVTTDADNTTDDNDCTLREALSSANNDASPNPGDCGNGSGDDTIELPAGDYDLTVGTPLAITSNVTIDGAGADTTSIDGLNGTKVISITGGSSIAIEGVTIENGNSADSGGCIDFDTAGAATLTLTAVQVSSCTTTGNGGGVFVQGMASAKVLNVRASTFDGNHADGQGGGINVGSGNSSAIINSTFSGNTADDDGGGIRVHGDVVITLNNVTIANNTADNDSAGGGEGGGIRRDPEVGGSFTVANTIIADNSDPSSHPDCSGSFTSGGSNIVENTTGCSGFTDPSDQTGVDPNLAPLADYGGPTETIGPNTTSDPPVDNGGAVTPCEPTDQRGVPRPQGSTCDVGSLELAQCGDGIVCDVDGCIPLEECDDGNTANGDCCDSQCQFEAPSSPCGNSSDTDCDNPDTCDGAGTCEDNLETVGTSCGSGADTGCDNPDTCDGSGSCQDNFETAGTGCGSASNTDCTDPDTCDGSGTCLANDEADGTQCTDTNTADCNDAQCASGACNQTAAFEDPGTACGDPSNTDCTNPDTCDAGGNCLPNHEADGTQCTDTNTADCNDARCASGACNQAAAFEDPGTACGDPSNTDCTNPDSCDAGGTCLSNDELPGTPCTDEGDICTEDECDGAGSCAHTFVDTDNDGVCDAVEASCDPGDENDPTQASLPAATGLGCITVELTAGCAQLLDVQALTEEDLGDDPDFACAFGYVDFTAPCEAASIKITYSAGINVSALTLRKFGPLVPGGSPPVFYTLPTTPPQDTTVVPPNMVTYNLLDNIQGDDTGDDGVIVDTAALCAATPPVPSPALNPWGTAAASLVLVSVAFMALRRRLAQHT